MNAPEWLKPALAGAVVGGAIVAIAGFSWAGWMTAGSADRMARTMSDESIVAAFVPVCLELAANDPERTTKLASVQEVTGIRRRDALMATGWATMPGSDAPSRGLAAACEAALDLAGA
jgi:hypothetical protein